jgi:hypothetical protein
MQATLTPSGDSDSISISATPAPRRGRPRIHKDDSAKKRAYRQRIYERKLAAKRRAKIRAAIRRLRKNRPQRDLLSEAKAAYLEGNHKLALALFEQHEAQAEMAEYDQEIGHEERRAAKPVKHNRACRGKSACLCGLTMSRGMFLTDAPKGRGKLVSGGYDSEKVALINDLRQIEEECGGSEVGGSGWGSDRDEKFNYKDRDAEGDYTFTKKNFQDSSWLKCYVKGCSRLPWAVLLEPEDYDGSTYYCCDLHLPTRIG